ncbi:MAG: phage tail sheath family protein [Dehalococcoidia bacterium]|nr:phage tail sheath family protein [Dehalococcoidia bacterium]MCA9857062.1 phage tail sheath family protein [Dehalococcoidia bacterium]MCB9483292.1 phage tail sheath family protein [Dehalococcoidia bacterium]
MAVYQAPGVYVEEVEGGSRPIQGVATAVAAFVGFTEKAPEGNPDDPEGVRPTLVTNWSQFERNYGSFTEGAMLPLAVYGFFANGGGRAYIVKVPHLDGEGNPRAVAAADLVGNEGLRTGINGLAVAEDVTMVAVPDLINVAKGADGGVDLETWQAVQIALVNHCESQKDRMAILDAPPGMNPQQVLEWRTNAGYDSMFAALYYPHIRIANPLSKPTNDLPKTITVPPSGHLAGLWARTDGIGVWKAPANEVLRGALDLEYQMTTGEQEILNPVGINAIRAFGVRGIRVWGARTTSSDPLWRYLNVRRLFNYIEDSLIGGTQWVVFEPNDANLWARARRTVNAFLLGLWRAGAMVGATPDAGFYVKCDEETNPREAVDEGRVTIEIGVAAVKPAEFVVIRIGQWAGPGAE